METLIDASKEVGLEVNTEKTKYMLLSRHQNAGQSYDIKIAKGSFENVVKFRYLGTTVTNQNLIQEKIKSRLNSGNACYHSVQNLLSSRLLSKNIKITQRIFSCYKGEEDKENSTLWCQTTNIMELENFSWHCYSHILYEVT
jgi:hypothetical protein